MNREKEIKKLLSMSAEEMVEKSRGRLVILPAIDDLHKHFADSIANEIENIHRQINFSKV